MSNSIYDLLGTDFSLETKGVWINYGDAGKFLLARAGGANTRYQVVMIEKMKPYRRQIQFQLNNPNKNTIDLLRKIQIEAMADTLILGWEGVTDQLGEPITYTREAALGLLQAVPALFDELQAAASDIANYKAIDLEGDIKN